MVKFNSGEFISALKRKINFENYNCPFCGGINFTTTEYCTSFVLKKEISNVVHNNIVPSGMLICENCGHIEFFALGPLGLLKESTENKEENKEESKEENNEK